VKWKNLYICPRVFNRLDLNDCTHADIVRELVFGSCLERYRNCPSNQLIIRELKIRFERTLKLLDTVGVELRKFSRAAAKELLLDIKKNTIELGCF
jgi:hypothetical protein